LAGAPCSSSRSLRSGSTAPSRRSPALPSGAMRPPALQRQVVPTLPGVSQLLDPDHRGLRRPVGGLGGQPLLEQGPALLGVGEKEVESVLRGYTHMPSPPYRSKFGARVARSAPSPARSLPEFVRGRERSPSLPPAEPRRPRAAHARVARHVGAWGYRAPSMSGASKMSASCSPKRPIGSPLSRTGKGSPLGHTRREVALETQAPTRRRR
jgi:hypothetical protein